MARQRHYRNPTEPGITVFVTTTILDFVPIFNLRNLADIAVRELANHHKKQGAALHAFVVMPEHMHFLTRLPPTQNASTFVGRFKSRLTDFILPELSPDWRAKFNQQRGLNAREMWKVGFRAFTVERGSVFDQKVNYIHCNPIRRELVEDPHTYRWSSAYLHEQSLWIEEHGLVFAPNDLAL
jgi:putative transposase